MKSTSVLLCLPFLGRLSCILAHGDHFGCGAEAPPLEEELESEASFARFRSQPETSGGFLIDMLEWFLCSFLGLDCGRPDQIIIPAYIHVLYNADGTFYVDEPTIQEMIDKANSDLADTDIVLDVRDVDYFPNDIWFAESYQTLNDMFAALRKGGMETLNIFVKDIPNNHPTATTCGQASYPSSSSLGFPDFVFINGRFFRPCGIDRTTLAHEIGKPSNIVFIMIIYFDSTSRLHSL